MDLSIRDWMFVIGVLLLMAVALDGYRRFQKDRSNRVRVSKSAKRRAKKTVVKDADEDVEDAPSTEKRATSSSLGVSRIDPNVFSDATSELEFDAAAGLRAEPVVDEAETVVDAIVETKDLPIETEKDHGDVDPLFEDPFKVDPSRLKKGVIDSISSLPDTNKLDNNDGVEVQQSLVFDGNSADVEPDEILVLNVMAPKKDAFSGEDLLHILLACDCRIGDMNIFHRYEDKDARGQVQFSIVNMVEPGTFDLDDIKNFSTPGVSFFLRLPGPENPVEAFDCMVEVAQCLVRNLSASMKDEMHSTVTEQTLEHSRQRIRDYQQRKLLP